MQYLYNDGTSYVFMDTRSYRASRVSPEVLGNGAHFLLENQEAVVATNEGRVLFVELPGLGRAHDHLHRARPRG